MPSCDVIIAGAGIIGVSTALELRQRGARVLLLDRGDPGREASAAAAGMLASADPETPLPLRALARESAQMYPDFVRKVEQVSGMHADFRRHGTIAVEDHAAPPEYQRLTPERLSSLEPALTVSGHSAYFVREDSVDPDLLMLAAVRAAELMGVEVKSAVTVSAMRSVKGEVEVETTAGRFEAKVAVNCCGAWSGAPVKPRKGQMHYVQPARAGLFQHVLRAPDVYLVPRSSGKILIGATVEDVGFDKSVEPETIEKLHATAARYVPELASAPVTSSWAGLRPGSPDDLPLIGETETPGIFLASGHFRNGILLAPVTARIVANLVQARPPEADIFAFSPLRFTNKR